MFNLVRDEKQAFLCINELASVACITPCIVPVSSFVAPWDSSAEGQAAPLPYQQQ